MRKLLFGLLTLAIVVFVALPGMAQGADDVAQALLDDGFYVESAYSTSGLANAIEQAGADAPFMVALNDNISDPSAFADSLLARIGYGTVVVITPESIGGASFDFDAGEVDALLDQVVEGLGSNDDLAAAVEEFAGGPGGINAGAVVVGLGLAGAGGLAVASYRRRRKLEQKGVDRVGEARGELERQVGLVANDILELNTKVQLADSDQVTDWYRRASATYAAVEEEVPTAASLAELEGLADRLDDARWELEACEASLNGDVIPERPADHPAACFFDPTHRAGVEEVELDTKAGNKTVGVCRDCAKRLRAGTPPQPSSINVGGRAVPAPQAPRASGGGGLDWMDVFSVIVDGSRIPYSVGRGRRSYGGGRVSMPRRSASSGRSTSRSSSGRSSGRSISRGRSRRR